MNLALDTIWEHPDTPSSAIDYLTGLAEELVRRPRGIRLSLIVSPRNRHRFAAVEGGCDFVVVPYSNERRLLRIATQQCVTPRRLAGRAVDLFYAAGNVGLLAGRLPQVVKINTLQHEQMPQAVGLVRSLYRGWGMRRSVALARRICANTEDTKRRICSAYGVPADKVVTIFEAVSEHFQPAPPPLQAAVRQRFHLPERFFLFSSALYAYKNPALAALPALYSAATALLYPSFSETFGKPLVEAMRCGTPIIAADATAIPEVLGGAGLLVDPRDPPALAAAMQAVALTPGLAAELARRGRERAQAFTWRSHGDRLAELFQRVLEEGPTGPVGRRL